MSIQRYAEFLTGIASPFRADHWPDIEVSAPPSVLLELRPRAAIRSPRQARKHGGAHRTARPNPFPALPSLGERGHDRVRTWWVSPPRGPAGTSPDRLATSRNSLCPFIAEK